MHVAHAHLTEGAYTVNSSSKLIAASLVLNLLVGLAACSSEPSTIASGDSSVTPSATPLAVTTPTTPTTPTETSSTSGQPRFRTDTACGTFDGAGCAPESERIDIDPPTFSNPTEITNPLFPISELKSAVLLGVVDGKPFRSETTLLPTTGTVVLEGRPVEVLLSQYMAYLDGRITEVALDRYAQADDGSVWYLGEDVYDYEDGTIIVSEGTWLAGRDGPPAMIMPAHPAVGQVFRAENIPGIVFEEVTITKIDETVDGPLGKVEGAIVAEELHLDGTTSDKIFAPGYGEFYSANDSEEEALSLAVPVDAESTPQPAELAELITGTWGLIESARLEEWDAVAATLERIEGSWGTLSEASVPRRVADTLDAALGSLVEAVGTRQVGTTTSAAIEVAQSALDLELRFQPASVVDIERFHLHAQQLRVDAVAADPAGVAAEVAALEWIRDRLTGSLTPDELQQIDDDLADLRTASNISNSVGGNLGGAADQAARLANLLRRLAGA